MTKPVDHGFLAKAEEMYRQGLPQDALAAAVTGLLATIVETVARDEREENLSRLHDEADNALGRVLGLADDLDRHPNASLKPTAFRDLAAQIRAAVDGEAPR